jgi:D-3-phosphoglycerate dehydrogenase
VTSGVLDAGKKLKIICCARGGPVNIDVPAATKRGITVTRTVGRNAQPVADHTIGLLLSEVRHIARSHNSLKNGSWFSEKNLRQKWRYPVQEMEGKTLGLVGFGQVAREVTKRAKGFSLNIIAFDPYVDMNVMKNFGVKKVDLDQLLRDSDFVSVHAREAPDTFHLLGDKQFSMMKSSGYVINTSRGSIIDEKALVKALKEKVIAGAAIDVFEDEPLKKDNPLLKLTNATITPHMAGGSDITHIRSARLVAGTLNKYLKGETLEPVEIVDPSRFT